MTNPDRTWHRSALLFALVGVAVLLAFSALDWRRARNSDPRSGDSRASGIPSAPQPESTLNTAPIGVRSVGASPSERVLADGWFGRIIDDRGQPYPRVRVGIRMGDSHEMFTTITDDDGGFQLPPPPSANDFGLFATTAVEGDPTVELDVRRGVWSPRKDLGDIVCARPVTIRGIVVDQDELPVPGAVVRTTEGELFAPVTTDRAGRFEVRFDPRSGTLRLQAHVEGYFGVLRGEELTRVSAGSVTEGVVVRVERGRRVEGRVVDQHGSPVSDAAVSFIAKRKRNEPSGSSPVEEELRAATTTDRDGRFLGLVPSRRDRMSILVSHPNCEPLDLLIGTDAALQRIEVTRFPQLRLIAREAGSSAPIAGLSIRIGFTDSKASDTKWSATRGLPWSRTDESGMVSCPWKNGPAAAVTLILEAPGFLRAKFGPIPCSEIESKPIDVSLVRGGTVRGVVIDSEGQPRANAEVLALIGSSRDEVDLNSALPPLAIVRSGSEGHYEFAGLPEGPTQFAVRLHPARYSYVQSVTTVACRVKAGSEPIGLDLPLPPLGSIDGVVVEGDVAARSKCFVECDTSNGSRIHVDPDLDGRFEIRDLPSGTAKLTVRVPFVDEQFLGSTSRELRIEPRGVTRVRLELDPSRLAFVSTRISLEGRPLVAGMVQFAGPGKRTAGWFSLDAKGRTSGYVGPSGSYVFEILDVLGSVIAERTIEVVAGRENSVDFDLSEQ